MNCFLTFTNYIESHLFSLYYVNKEVMTGIQIDLNYQCDSEILPYLKYLR